MSKIKGVIQVPEGTKTNRLTGSDRISTLAERQLTATGENPLTDLKEICKTGMYISRFNWDKFLNGIMLTCEVFYYLDNKKHSLIKKTKFFHETTDLKACKVELAGSILSEIGILKEESSDEEELNVETLLDNVLGQTKPVLVEGLMNIIKNVMPGLKNEMNEMSQNED